MELFFSDIITTKLDVVSLNMISDDPAYIFYNSDSFNCISSIDIILAYNKLTKSYFKIYFKDPDKNKIKWIHIEEVKNIKYTYLTLFNNPKLEICIYVFKDSKMMTKIMTLRRSESYIPIICDNYIYIVGWMLHDPRAFSYEYNMIVLDKYTCSVIKSHPLPKIRGWAGLQYVNDHTFTESLSETVIYYSIVRNDKVLKYKISVRFENIKKNNIIHELID